MDGKRGRWILILATTAAGCETAEEIGLDLASGGELLGALDEIQAMARGRAVDLVISPFVFRLTGGEELRLSEEVVSAHWLPLDDLLGEACRSWLDYRYGDAVQRIPCLRVDDLVIWGLTYRMFTGLALRLGPPRQ